MATGNLYHHSWDDAIIPRTGNVGKVAATGLRVTLNTKGTPTFRFRFGEDVLRDAGFTDGTKLAFHFSPTTASGQIRRALPTEPGYTISRRRNRKTDATTQKSASVSIVASRMKEPNKSWLFNLVALQDGIPATMTVVDGEIIYALVPGPKVDADTMPAGASPTLASVPAY